MEDIITSIFMCVVMPIAIVWLVMRTKLNETNKMAEVMIKTIEAGTPIDPSFFKEQPLRKTIKQMIYLYDQRLGLLPYSQLFKGVCYSGHVFRLVA